MTYWGRIALAVFFVVAGINHFVHAGFYIAIVPPGLPAPAALVSLTGVLEILGGVGVLVPRVRRAAGWGLILLLLAVYPANLYMAIHPDHFPRYPAVALYARLPFQLLFIAWTWWATQRRSHPTPSND